jgi:hypothetical protein
MPKRIRKVDDVCGSRWVFDAADRRDCIILRFFVTCGLRPQETFILAANRNRTLGLCVDKALNETERVPRSWGAERIILQASPVRSAGNARRRYRVRKHYQTGDIKEQRGLLPGKVHGPPPLASVHHKQENAQLMPRFT